ncbi:hypothetical protein [Alteromonas sp. S167]|uniref:hypothetical protein n=1 Tax=Alteromonas sp. S167 TaxID=3117402 RepID=UPI002FE360D2
MTKYLALLLLFCFSPLVLADKVEYLECSVERMEDVDPYKHFLVRLMEVRMDFNRQRKESRFDSLDLLIFDTLQTIRSLGCYSDSLGNIRKLRDYFRQNPTGSKRIIELATEMGA